MAATFLRHKFATIPNQFALTAPRSLNLASFHSRFFPRSAQLQSHVLSRTMVEHVSTYRANGDNGDQGSTEGELNAWKYRAPYRIHDSDPSFHVRYEASCHCGKIKYQLSREKPLDAKYCHCHTCQKLHGMPFHFISFADDRPIQLAHS